MTTLETSSASETEAFAAKFAESLVGGAVLTLSGELGAGKTVFVRGLARGLGIASTPVTSPTYVLQHVYRGGRLTLFHIDAYRIAGSAAEFEASGLLECFNDPNGIVCVEWPERLTGLSWPPRRIHIEIEHLEADSRKITVKS